LDSFRGRSVFISGGASGIGFSVAQALAAEGAHVAIGDIDLSAAQAAAAKIEAAGVKAVAIQLDVAASEDWARAATTAEDALGPISLLHSNAGVGGVPVSSPEGRLVENISLENWRWVMGVNLDSHFFALKTFLPRFKALGGDSHIILTASVAGLRPPRNITPVAYVVSKYATIGLSEYMRAELADTPQIGFSVLCPGIVATNISENSAATAPYSEEAARVHGPSPVRNGMRPDVIGPFTLDAVRKRQHYIFTHPEYRSLFEQYHRDIIRSFGASADPSHQDQVPTFSFA
jgi:NAD(P)-dependent dehydrogenase (short-subunit alcohol dehydrogenase family)